MENQLTKNRTFSFLDMAMAAIFAIPTGMVSIFSWLGGDKLIAFFTQDGAAAVTLLIAATGVVFVTILVPIARTFHSFQLMKVFLFSGFTILSGASAYLISRYSQEKENVEAVEVQVIKKRGVEDKVIDVVDALQFWTRSGVIAMKHLGIYDNKNYVLNKNNKYLQKKSKNTLKFFS